MQFIGGFSMKKSIITLLLVSTLLISLVGCGTQFHIYTNGTESTQSEIQSTENTQPENQEQSTTDSVKSSEDTMATVSQSSKPDTTSKPDESSNTVSQPNSSSKENSTSSKSDDKTNSTATSSSSSSSNSASSSGSATSSQSNTISRDEAKSIAFTHAGVNEADVRGLEIEFDRDNGILKYEINFDCKGYEYDYDINAETGAILSAEKDRD